MGDKRKIEKAYIRQLKNYMQRVDASFDGARSIIDKYEEGVSVDKKNHSHLIPLIGAELTSIENDVMHFSNGHSMKIDLENTYIKDSKVGISYVLMDMDENIYNFLANKWSTILTTNSLLPSIEVVDISINALASGDDKRLNGVPQNEIQLTALKIIKVLDGEITEMEWIN
jgi:hypothetical protein